jgi:hypothetical protein
MKPLILLALASGCIVGTHRESDQEQAVNWGVYDPQPGHPTVPERDSFVAQIGQYAQEAEAIYGVPAAALTAMACNESGFGWTRIALYANNLFGWKWYSAETAGGRPKWTLEGQPDWDPGKDYIKFADRRDAVLFVAQKLANNARYKPHTDRYINEIAYGVDVKTAANTWIRGIAFAGYNPYEHYPTTTVKFMNNYRSPSTTFSAAYNLYQLSPALESAWVSIDSPAANTSVGGDVVVVASVGGVNITSVRFSTRAKGTTTWYSLGEDAAPPFSRTWATDPWVGNGAYEIRAEALSGTTLKATGSIGVTVAN